MPTDIVFQVLLCRLRYKLSFCDIAEFFLLRRFEFTHQTVRDWEERFAPIFIDQLRAKRQGKVGKIWFVDETYIRVKGKWCYLYRGIDSANRDSTKFQAGGCFDVRRHNASNHLSFGHGIHFCLGAMLARKDRSLRYAIAVGMFAAKSR